MDRPVSIVNFERLYLGSFVLWLVSTLAFWSTTSQTMLTNPAVTANPQMAQLVTPIMLGAFVVVAAVTLLLWYLVARKASSVAKWFVVAFEAIGVLKTIPVLLAIARGTTGNVLLAVIGLVCTALAVAAAVMLFKRDARAWLGELEPMGPAA